MRSCRYAFSVRLFRWKFWLSTEGMNECIRGGPSRTLHRDLQWSVVLILKVYKHRLLDRRQPYRLVTERNSQSHASCVVGREWRNMRDEKYVLDAVQDNPPIATRQIYTIRWISHSTLRRTLAWNSVASFPVTTGKCCSIKSALSAKKTNAREDLWILYEIVKSENTIVNSLSVQASKVRYRNSVTPTVSVYVYI
jgi:hypothetical protein